LPNKTQTKYLINNNIKYFVEFKTYPEVIHYSLWESSCLDISPPSPPLDPVQSSTGRGSSSLASSFALALKCHSKSWSVFPQSAGEDVAAKLQPRGTRCPP